MKPRFHVVELITIEAIKESARQLLEESKKDLLRRGGLWHRAYVYAPSSRLPAIGLAEAKGEEGTAIVVVDLAPADASAWLSMLRVCDTKFRERIFPELAAAAPRMGVKSDRERDEQIFRVFRDMGMNESEICSRYLRWFVEQLHAYAVVHISDSWYLHAEPEEGKPFDRSRYARNLEQEPQAREALVVSVETQGSFAMTTVPYERAARGTGRVTRFLDPVAGDSSDGTWSGRFFGLLHALPRS